MSVDVPTILYTIINEIGRDKIRMEITSDIASSKSYCTKIINECEGRVGTRSDPETLATLCEGLLHFMLTASLLPSERKLKIKGYDFDIVVPSTKILLGHPEKSLVIQVIKNRDELAKVKSAELIQPNRENIWLISFGRLSTDCRNYCLDDNSFSRVLVDIHDFVSAKGVGGLKLFH